MQQPTSFQCVGGNDQIIIKLEEKLEHEFKNCCIYKNSPVKHIRKLPFSHDKTRYLIEIDNKNVDSSQCQSCKVFVCDIVISNVPLPLVRELIPNTADNFDETFIEYLNVFKDLRDSFYAASFLKLVGGVKENIGKNLLLR